LVTVAEPDLDRPFIWDAVSVFSRVRAATPYPRRAWSERAGRKSRSANVTYGSIEKPLKVPCRRGPWVTSSIAAFRGTGQPESRKTAGHLICAALSLRMPDGVGPSRSIFSGRARDER
jgi:hypothetical protein